ncbi:hypothetical protein BsWGS_28441 [Bradybaena similaris]
MASKQVPSKRRLPAWMEVVHHQNSSMSNSRGESPSLDLGVSEQLETDQKRPHLVNSSELKAVDESAAHCPDEEVKQISAVKRAAVASVSAGQVIEQAMPLLTFTGRPIYSCHYADCAGICDDLLTSLSSPDPVAVGFDMEWPVSFQKGSSSKTALIQLCFSETACYLFHVSAMLTLPVALKNLIGDARVMLVGLNIEADLWRLERDYDFRVKALIDRGSVIDVGRLANQKLKSSEKWTLDGLCKNVLRKWLNKDVKLRCGDWREVPLSAEQKLYASTDAYAGLLLYQYLSNK